MKMWRRRLKIKASQHFEVPLGLQELSGVGFMGGGVFIWGLVDPNEKAKRTLTIRMVDADSPMETEHLRFLGIVAKSNDLWWHIWEVLERE